MTSTLDVLDSDNVLNRGTVANDNTGDTLRSAGLKINNQFENVDSAMFNTSWAEWPAGVKENNSVLRYNGSKFVGTNNVKIDSDGNTTVSGTLDATGAATFSNTLSVTSTSTFTDSATFSANLGLDDNITLNIGDSNDLQIYHNGTQSIIKDAGTGQLKILAENTLYMGSATGSETYIRALKNGIVELSYAGLAKLATSSTGVDVSGSITVDGDITFSDSDDIIMPDKSKIKMGTGDDLQIYHDGSNSFISTNVSSPGDLYIDQRSDNKKIILRSDNGSGGNIQYIIADGSTGEVKLYHYGSEKLATKATGVDVTGEVTADSATISGSLTVDTDTLFVDAVNNKVGIGTASPTATLDVNGHMAIDTNSGQTSSISQAAIATFTAATFSGAKLVVTAKDGSNRYISELLITHNGTTAVATEYGQVATSSALATYDVDINGGNVRLLATPVSTNTTTFKVMKLLLID